MKTFLKKMLHSIQNRNQQTTPETHGASRERRTPGVKLFEVGSCHAWRNPHLHNCINLRKTTIVLTFNRNITRKIDGT